MILDQLRVPIVLAPLGGGPSTPQLAAGVTEAGGLGFLAWAYLSAEAAAASWRAARERTAGPLGVNVFVGGSGPADPETYSAYVDTVRAEAAERGLEVGEPRWDDDGYEAKIDLLAADPPEVVSFTFGCPTGDVIQRLQRAGAEVWVTVTAPEEAREAAATGADGVIVQGAEAGGHRGSFADRPDAPVYGLLPLLALVRSEVVVPLVASGGLATGDSIAAALAAGARAAQIGTAFMLAPEAGTSQVHRAALAGPEATDLTRAFSGRLARGIRNRFMLDHGPEAPIAYPELHHLTAPMRKQGRERGDADVVNLWAGEAHQLARELPAAQIVRELAAETTDALRQVCAAAARRDRLPPEGRARDWLP